MRDNNEPSLEKIDDYDGKESPEKRNTVRRVIIFLLVIGAIYAFIKSNTNSVDDYVGTPEKPGIDVTKGR